MRISTGPLWLWIAVALLLLAGVSLFPTEHQHWFPWGIALNDTTIIPVVVLAVVLHVVAGWIIRRKT
jgi:hypothetical protein